MILSFGVFLTFHYKPTMDNVLFIVYLYPSCIKILNPPTPIKNSITEITKKKKGKKTTYTRFFEHACDFYFLTLLKTYFFIRIKFMSMNMSMTTYENVQSRY